MTLSFTIPSYPAVLYNAKNGAGCCAQGGHFLLSFSVSFISFGLLIPS